MKLPEYCQCPFPLESPVSPGYCLVCGQRIWDQK